MLAKIEGNKKARTQKKPKKVMLTCSNDWEKRYKISCNAICVTYDNIASHSIKQGQNNTLKPLLELKHAAPQTAQITTTDQPCGQSVAVIPQPSGMKAQNQKKKLLVPKSKESRFVQ